MTIQEMKEKKAALGYTCEQIAGFSGVPLETVQKIFCSDTANPQYDVIQAIEKVFLESKDLHVQVSEAKAMYMREPEAAYTENHSDGSWFGKKQGDYSLEDYYRGPNDIRVELIDGVIYDMGDPTSTHQLIVGYIYTKLLTHIMSKKGKCLPVISPIDVQLDCNDRTMIQPDMVIVCDRDKITDRCIYGAPDFIIEILSKSTWKKDAVIKLNKYFNAGVREYWMIDPVRLKILVYNFAQEDELPMIYGFTDKVPVRIWDDECMIDFQEVYEHIRFLYERPQE